MQIKAKLIDEKVDKDCITMPTSFFTSAKNFLVNQVQQMHYIKVVVSAIKMSISAK